MTQSYPTVALTDAVLAELSADRAAPCLSLYQPTSRHFPENQQDPIRYRNLVKELSASMRGAYPPAEIDALLEPFEALADDAEFWRHTLDGLAVLGGDGVFFALRTPQSVGALAVVADSFHTKPLRRFLQSVDRYQVLCLSLDKFRMFEGNRHALDELDLGRGLPLAGAAALADDPPAEAPPSAAEAGLGGAVERGGHGKNGRWDEMGSESDRYFRAVDRAVLERFSKPSGLPLILAALPEHHHRFRAHSVNPQLIDEGLQINAEAVDLDALRALAWAVMEPRYDARIATLANDFERARGCGLGSDRLTEVASAAAAGRVGTLLIAADRQIAGDLDDSTGQLLMRALSDPHTDDLLDDLGELVVKLGGVVVVVPPDRLDLPSGVAAIYRY